MANGNKTNMAKKPNNKRARNNKTEVIRAPISGGAIYRNQPAMMRQTRDGILVSHCEPFFTLNGGAAGVFVSATSALMPHVMPWLNGVAVNYSKWRWNSLELIYIPSVPTTTTGEMAAAILYDRADQNPAVFSQIQTIYRAVSSPVWGGYEGSVLLNQPNSASCAGAITIRVDVGRFGQSWYKYITQGNFAVLPPSDQNFYCPVTMVAGDQGAPGVQLLGRFFAKYTIELIEPFNAGLAS